MNSKPAVARETAVPSPSKVPRLIAYMANAAYLFLDKISRWLSSNASSFPFRKGNRLSSRNRLIKPPIPQSQTKTLETLNDLKDKFEKVCDFLKQLNNIQVDGQMKINSLKKSIEDLTPSDGFLDLKKQILDVKKYEESIRKILDNVQTLVDSAKHLDEPTSKPSDNSRLPETPNNSETGCLSPRKPTLDKSCQTSPEPQPKFQEQHCQTDSPNPENFLNFSPPNPNNLNRNEPKRSINEFYQEPNTKTVSPTLSINIKLKTQPGSIARKARMSLPGNFCSSIHSILPQKSSNSEHERNHHHHQDDFHSLKNVHIGFGVKGQQSPRSVLEDSRWKRRTSQKTVSTQTTFMYDQMLSKVGSLARMYLEMVNDFKKFREFASTYNDHLHETCLGIEEQTWKAVNNLIKSNKELTFRYKQEMSLRKKYHNELMQIRGNIRVFCRIRPPTATDKDPNSSCISISPNDTDVIFVKTKNKLARFELDRVFSPSSSQSEVYDEIRSLVTSCIDGFNVCILAYGQTGSGKTYTMEGNPNNPGMNQRALKDLFKETGLKDDWNYSISVSMVEIYNEQIRDLLNEEAANRLEVWNVEDVTNILVYSVEEVNKVCASGHKNRSKASTNLNTSSSRSHALLCVRIEGCNYTTNTRTKGKLYLIDLAGSENVEKSGVDGQRLKEAGFINKSLSTFSDVINAILLKKTHIPYRNSKLTHLLQDSLGGNSKTLLITQVAPGDAHVSETVQTLQFAQRIRSIQCLSSSNSKSREKLDSDNGKNESPKIKKMDENSSVPISSIPPRFSNMFMASPINTARTNASKNQRRKSTTNLSM